MYTQPWGFNKSYICGDIVLFFDFVSTSYYICINNHVSSNDFYKNQDFWLKIKPEFIDEMIQHGMTISYFDKCINSVPVNPPPNLSLTVDIPPTKDLIIKPDCSFEQNKNKRKLDKIEIEIEKYNISKKNKTTLSKREQILLLKAPIDVKSFLLNKYDNIKKQTSTEYEKSINWLNTVLNLPFEKKKYYDIDLDKIKQTLDKEIYGHESIKRTILQFFAKKKSNPNSKGQILALHGSKGVGKTKIIRDALAKAINLPFFQINCGGLNDVAVINGHSSTYVGSKPGKIVDILVESNFNNPIILFDELDKVSDYKKKEIYGIFTHLFDEQQNKCFQDNYIGNLNIDLSNVFFVVTFNNIADIDPILLDRFKVIDVPNPTFDDKIEICKKMFNQIKKEIWNDASVIFDDDQNDFFRYLIYNYHSSDVGLRQIKNSIYSILENINLDNYLSNLSNNTIHINIPLIDKYLFLNNDSKEYLNMYL